MPATVLAGNLLAAGLNATFRENYSKAETGSPRIKLADCMTLDLPSDKLTEPYAYAESAPYPRRNDRGSAPPTKGFLSQTFNVTNKDWELRIGWHENDREDDQIGVIFQRAEDGGQNFATLDERVFFQILTGSTDANLLEAIPTDPTGVALYSATDAASAARYGVTGGNIETGGGVATTAAIRTDFFDAIERFRGFQDTEGQPLWSDERLDAGFVLYYNHQNSEVVNSVFQQGRTLEVGASFGGGATTNLIMDSGIKVDLRPTQRITDNDMFVFLRGPHHKPVFKQLRKPITEHFATKENSDYSRNTGEEYIQWKSRAGYGVNQAYGTVKINN